jgi:hypothetical protein
MDPRSDECRGQRRAVGGKMTRPPGPRWGIKNQKKVEGAWNWYGRGRGGFLRPFLLTSNCLNFNWHLLGIRWIWSWLARKGREKAKSPFRVPSFAPRPPFLFLAISPVDSKVPSCIKWLDFHMFLRFGGLWTHMKIITQGEAF